MSGTPPQHDGLYFSRLYEAVRFPIGTAEKPGLRRGQRAALHAIASYFALRDQPAVVTMPTGSGKSVVLALAAALTRLWREPELRQRMGEAGRRTATSRFSLARHLDEFHSLYREVAGR